MGFNRLHKHRAPHHNFVSADSDAARNPHRFILQNVNALYKKQMKMDKDIKKLFFISGLPTIIILTIFFFVFVKINSTDEELDEYILPMKFYGKVIEKKIDYSNHATEYIIVKGQDSCNIIIDNITWYPIYNSSEIGDSIYKEQGSWYINIVKKDNNEISISFKPSKFYLHRRKWNKK